MLRWLFIAVFGVTPAVGFHVLAIPFSACLRAFKVFWNWLTTPAVFEGFLLVGMAGCGFIITTATGDEAYKYVNIYVLWWTRCAFGFQLACFTALKTFRSTSYAQHVALHQNDVDEPPPIVQPPVPKVQIQPETKGT